MTTGKPERARPSAGALAFGVLLGFGFGLTTLGVLLWRAGGSEVGIEDSTVQWTVMCAMIGGFAGLIATRAVAQSEAIRSSRATVVLGLLALANLGLAALAFVNRPEPADTISVSNAPLFSSLAPGAFGLAAVLIAAATALHRWWSIPRSRGGRLVAAAGAILVAGGLVLVVLPLQSTANERAHEANTSFSAAQHAPGELSSELTGEVAWEHEVNTANTFRMLNTAGGIAIRQDTPGGIRMLDPATGGIRWTWQRADLDEGVHPMVVSDDGTLIAAGFHTYDQFPQPPRTVVLDAESGEVRAELPNVAGVPISVSEDRIVMVGGREAFAYDFDGEHLWSTEVSEPIESDLTTATGDIALLTVDTDEAQWGTEAIDTRTGETLWSARAPARMGTYRVVPGSDVAVAGGLRANSAGRVVTIIEPVTARVSALGLADGEPAWERDVTIPDGVSGQAEADGCLQRLDIDPSHLTFVGCTDNGSQLVFTSLDPSTGEVNWERSVTPEEGQWGPRLEADDPLQAMSDGTTAFFSRAGDNYECAISRVGPDGVELTPIVEGLDRPACDNLNWVGTNETALIRQFQDIGSTLLVALD